MTIPMIVLVFLVGFPVGVLSALLGVGGGIIMVPFMVFFLEATQQVAEGTSLLVIIPTALAGVLSNRKEQRPSIRDGAILGAGGVVGALIGASLALVIAADLLQVIFAVLLVIAGLEMLLDGLRNRRAASA